MSEAVWLSLIGSVVLLLLPVSVAARAVLRPHREPASRIAWVAAIFGAPVFGSIAYFLLGETNVGRARREREREISRRLQAMPLMADANETAYRADIPARWLGVFGMGRSVNGFVPVGGNAAMLTADSNDTIDAVVADIDAAKDHVHITFYIWLADNNGLRVVKALERAAARGVNCRVLADGIGSRALIGSEYWKGMRAAGVKAMVALRVGNVFVRMLSSRIDLRNHRKSVIIDNHICYFGSQNCADPEFRVKPDYAPWVDIMLRFEGPLARQSQCLFVADWMVSVREDLSAYLYQPFPPAMGKVSAQAIGTGPTVRTSAMPEVFSTVIFSAQRELIITTPYFVPDETIMSALCAAGRRGVAVTIIFPARNDSRIVAAASHSYYRDLLRAGVAIHEFHGGLLHAKTMTVDGEIALIGSANMDRRSFDLNYENNVLIDSVEVTRLIVARQRDYLGSSTTISEEDVDSWSTSRRLWNNTVAMLGPIL